MKNKIVLKFIFLILLFHFNQAYSQDLFILNSNPVNNNNYKINQVPKTGDIMFNRDVMPNTAEIILYNLSDNKVDPIVLEKIRVKSSYLISFTIPKLSYGKYKITWRIKPCLESCLSNKINNSNIIDYISGDINFNIVNEENNNTKLNFIILFIFILVLFFFIKIKKTHQK